MYIKRITIISIIVIITTSIVLAQQHTSPNYTLSNTKIITSGGSANSEGFSLANVAIGGVFGGKAGSLNYELRAGFMPRVSFKLISLNWLLEDISPGETKIKRIEIENDGDVDILCYLRVIDATITDETKKWQASSVANGNSVENNYVLSGIFTDLDITDVGESYFNETGSEDLILKDFQESTDIRFATTRSIQNGVDIKPITRRALWLKFDAPKIDTTNEKNHNLWLIVKVEEVN